MGEQTFTHPADSEEILRIRDGDRWLVLDPGESIPMAKAVKLGIAKKGASSSSSRSKPAAKKGDGAGSDDGGSAAD